MCFDQGALLLVDGANIILRWERYVIGDSDLILDFFYHASVNAETHLINRKTVDDTTNAAVRFRSKDEARKDDTCH